MKFKFVLFLLFIVDFSFSQQSNSPLYLDPQMPSQERVEDLMSIMTLEEKVGQMCQYVGLKYLLKEDKNPNLTLDELTKLNTDALAQYNISATQITNEIVEGKIGSFLHVLDPDEANYLQSFTLQSKLKIPLLIGIDAIHGNAMVSGTTVYPSPISIAATFENKFAFDVAQQSAREMRATGSHWAFTPNVDVSRDPRWGRVGETFGEDPFLVGEMGAAMIRGFQGNDFSEKFNVIACAKHMIAGAEPLNGLNISPMDVSKRTLYEVHLPPYKKAIDAGVYTIMAAHNELNGIPCHMHKELMTDVLRNQWGFGGFYVSDWYDVKRIWEYHRIAKNYKEASFLSVDAGMDMNMHGPKFFDHVVALVNEGQLSIDRVNEACAKILYAKFQLGLFEQRMVDKNQIEEHVFIESHKNKSLEISDKSITLLKNKNLLPFKKTDAPKRILVTGPNANNSTTLGDWHFEQPAENVITILEGLEKISKPHNYDVDFFDSGQKIREIQASKIEEAAQRSKEYDYVVVVVGDNSLRYDWEGGRSRDKTAGENKARADIKLPGKQIDLIQSISQQNPNVVVVYVSGKPVGEPWIQDHIPAIVHAWEPGSMGGLSLAKILFGELSPSGKLPLTVPRSVGQLQMVYNHKPSNYKHKYAFEKTAPLYPFGFGLSYTDFSISAPSLSNATLSSDQTEILSVTITNTGSVEAEEVVQLYVRDLFSSVTRPVKELKGYQRVSLQPGESKEVRFMIKPEMLAFYDFNMNYVVEPGKFSLMVGNSSRTKDLQSIEIEVLNKMEVSL